MQELDIFMNIIQSFFKSVFFIFKINKKLQFNINEFSVERPNVNQYKFCKSNTVNYFYIYSVYTYCIVFVYIECNILCSAYKGWADKYMYHIFIQYFKCFCKFRKCTIKELGNKTNKQDRTPFKT